mgnify:CR=1 FL=1
MAGKRRQGDRSAEGRGRTRPWKRRRTVAFLQSVVAYCLAPIIVLALFEIGLRVAGVGFSTGFFLNKSLEGRPFRVTNSAFYQQFFKLPVRGIWRGSEWTVTPDPPSDVCRVFVFGGSAAQGYPDPAYSFYRVLEAMLRACYPHTQFEVYSAAYPGCNSHAMRAAAHACATADPDLFIVYMGNNEVNGPFGAVTAVGRPYAMNLTYVRGRMLLGGLRTAQVATGNQRRLWRNMLPPVQQYFHRDDPILGSVQENFRTNLADMCVSAKNAGIPIVLCSVAGNLGDWMPEKSLHRPDLTDADLTAWQERYEAGITLQEQKAFAAALDVFGEASEIDDTYAELPFRMATCLLELGEDAKALSLFILARDCDAMRSRTDSALNEIVRQTASEMASPYVHFVDAERSVCEAANHGIPGDDQLFDTCHLTFEGNWLLGRCLFEYIHDALPEFVNELRRREPEPRPARPLTEEECAKELALTDLVLTRDLRVIVTMAEQWKKDAGPSVREHLASLEARARPDDAVATIEAYREVLARYPNDFIIRSRCAEELLEAGRHAEALEQAQQLVEYHPFRRDSRRLLGEALAASERLPEALDVLTQLCRVYPDDEKALFALAKTRCAMDDPEGGLNDYRRGLRFDPNAYKAIVAMGDVIEELGDHGEAAATYRRAIRISRRSSESFERLDALWRQTLSPEGRAAKWRGMVAEFSDAPLAFSYLGSSLRDVSDWQGAVDAFARWVDLSPDDEAAREFLGAARSALDDQEALVLARSGDKEGAVARLREAIRRTPHASQFYEDLDSIVGTAEERTRTWRELVDEIVPPGRARFHLGLALADAGRAGEAIEVLRTASEEMPDDGAVRDAIEAVRAARGVAEAERLVTQQRWRDAIAAYEEAVRMKPSDPDLYDRLDVLLREHAPLPRRVEVWEQLAEAEPGRSQLYLGLALRETGEYEASVQVLGKAFERLPDDPAVGVELMRSQGLLALDQAREFSREGQSEEAIERYLTAIRALPRDNLACDELDVYLRQSGGLSAAIATWRALADEVPELPRISYLLGLALMETGEVGGAVEALDQAAVRDPDDPAVWVALGRACLDSARWERAAEALTKALDHNPDIPNLRPDLVAALVRSNLPGKAWLVVDECASRGEEIPPGVMALLPPR